ncbi:MAG: hypothetical protein IID44_24515 [Planctomycetes bacterium]|nr:hypothetical protein [Planctomycetota bacterium]MCH8046878.1 hypothetical protein [Planctomycetota bacterium]
MLYLGIDQHRKQITVNLRNEEGGFVAILEVCGFNDWLLEMLDEYDCQQTVLVQPEKRSKKKTDRRGSKIARVAVMRRLTTIIWRMVRDQQPYVTGGRPSVQKMQACFKAVET